MDIAQDGRAWPVTSHGQDWQIAWLPPPDPPEGISHGSAAVCFSGDQVVLVSDGDERWGMPGGRPEAGETWVDVLVREVLEEACADVTAQRLIGYSRGSCVRGPEQGRILVRAWWVATVELRPWQPGHETTGRRLVSPGHVYDSIWIEDGFAPLYRRIMREAGLRS
ncbi:NUDIX domain-containing protein [Nonomuraea typhae]|uniref:NUDIX domain-containing protein n=1 Tax=Nonomuraea typhae TaxID=2603600 RepID=A0ABW7Z6X8_9ACTN